MATAEGPAGLEEGYMQIDPEAASVFKSPWACTTPLYTTGMPCGVHTADGAAFTMAAGKGTPGDSQEQHTKCEFSKGLRKPYVTWRFRRLGSTSRQTFRASFAVGCGLRLYLLIFCILVPGSRSEGNSAGGLYDYTPFASSEGKAEHLLQSLHWLPFSDFGGASSHATSLASPASSRVRLRRKASLQFSGPP